LTVNRVNNALQPHRWGMGKLFVKGLLVLLRLFRLTSKQHFSYRKLLYLLAIVLLSGFCGLLSAQTVIWSEDFEEAGNDTYTINQATIPGLSNQWAYRKNNNGQLRMAAGAGYYRSGSRAATLDANPTGQNSNNFLIATIDLSAYSSFSHFNLSFSYMDHGDENHANDRVWARAEATDTWIEIYDLQPESTGNGNWNDISDIDISGPLTGAGQTITNTIFLRFGQRDNWSSTSVTQFDGITFDDISVSGSIRISDGGTVSTCSGTFYDSGGSGGDYSNNETSTITFCSDNGGAMSVEFTDFNTQNANDFLVIYDGPTTGDPVITTLSGNLGAGAGTYVSAGTCLTFYFQSNNGGTQSGWEATISCTDPCAGLPVLTFDPIENVCEDAAAFNLTEASPSGGTYSGTGITTSPEFDPSVSGAGIHTITYTYTDINGCTGDIDQTIEVESLPTFGYKYATSLTLDAASGTEDLTDFPVLVQVNSAPTTDSLRTVSNGGHVENANGYDIAFTDENYSQLDHQIESYDPVTGVFIAWVRIPLLSNSSTTTINMVYGNASISSDPSSTDVWISSYKGVWHLTNVATDATSTGNDGTESNTSDIAGAIAGGKSFNGSSSFIRFFPLSGMTENDENQTLSIWAQYATVPGGNRNFFSIQNPGSAVQIGFRGGDALAWRWGGTILATSGFAPSTGAWHYYVYTFDGTTHRIYIDGVDQGSSTQTPQALIPVEGNLGRYNNGEYFNGWLDEARYSLSPISPTWIATEYSNQSNPSGFVSYGSERVTTDTISVGVCVTSYTLEDGYPAGGVYSGPGVSGTNFNPSVAGVGTHTLTYTFSAGACTGASATKVFIVTPAPSAPVASDVACCVSNILDLTATGTNLNWYYDPGLTTHVGFGSPYATGQTTTGTYTYYVTQTVNGCESPATVVTLTISNTTPGGTLSATPVCTGENTLLTLTGYAGNILRYEYSTTSSTGPWSNIAHVYDTLTYGPIVSDIWFRALVLAGSCPQSYSSVVAVTGSTSSVAPTSASSDRNNICPNDGNIELSYSGGTLGTGATAEWYSDAGFTTNVGSGNNLTITTPGSSTTYYVRFEGDCNTTLAQSVLVTIDDLTSPVFAPPPVDVTVECSTDVPVMTNLAWTDNCDGAGVVAGTDVSDGFTCPETITRTWTYTDAGSNTASVSQTIIVDDTQAPTWTTLANALDVSVACDDGAGLTAAQAMLPVATDNCDLDVSDIVKTTGALVGTTCGGTYTNTWVVTDDCGNTSAVYTQVITLTDVVAPTWTTLANALDVSVACDDGAGLTAAQAMLPVATDNCDLDVSDIVKTTGALVGTTCGGTYTNTWVVTDDCGNTSAVYTQVITLTDVVAPTASDLPPVSVECIGDVPPVDITDVSDEADNCTALPVVAFVSDLSDDGSCPEIITRTYSVTDDCGNSINVTQTITINDITPPTAICQDITVQLDASGLVSITAADVDNGSTDNCGIEAMWLDIYDFDCTNVGPNTVNLFVSDSCGTISSCAAIVTVEDNIPPVITCPGDETHTAVAGSCSVLVSGIAPVFATDNCSNAALTYRLEGATTGTGVDDASGTAFEKGVTTVWYVITDPYNNADSCSFDITVLTTIVPPDSAFSSVDEVCPGDGDIILYYDGGVMVEGGTAVWYDDAGLTNVIGTDNALTIPAPVVTTTYYLRFEGSCDISTAVSAIVTVKPLTVDPTTAFVDRTDICAGDGSIVLSYIGGDLGSNGTAVWYEDAGFSSGVGSGNDLTIAVPAVTTTYYLRFEADCDTSAAVSAEVTVWPIPEPVFVEMTENVCINGPLYRYVAGGLAGSTYTWNIVNGTIVSQDNDTVYVDWGSQIITGTVEVTETTVNGCISVPVTLQVEVGGPDLDLGEDPGLCVGESITIDPVGDFDSYLWHDGSTGPDYTTDQEGWIVLSVTDPYACEARDSIYVTVYELPVVDLGPDTIVCGEEGLRLDAGTDGIYYQWSTGEISQEITVFRGGPEEYRVEVENEYGCVGGDTITVENCTMEFFFRDIPTAITPSDGNGLNDFWEIDKLASFSQVVVEIFDRWGTLVWRSEPGYSNPWDGRNMKGEEMPMDSYHFVFLLNSGAEGRDDRVTGIITVIK